MYHYTITLQNVSHYFDMQLLLVQFLLHIVRRLVYSPSDRRAKTYAGCVGELLIKSALRLEKENETDRQTDREQDTGPLL